jgi:UDP:flavonoid glycosyltransferase YjiC (YdhE family)
VPVRFLFSSTPEASHLAPQLPLALELHSRGHDVLVGCSPKLGAWAQALGLRTAPCGLDLDPDHLGDLRRMGVELVLPEDRSPENLTRWWNRVGFAEVFAQPMAADLRRVAEAFRPDMMVRDRGEYAEWVVGDALDVPVVTVTFGRVPDLAYEIETASEPLQRLRDLQGLEPDPELQRLFTGLVLVPAPPSYADPDVPVLVSVRFVQPMTLDLRGDDALPAWVGALGARPVVYVTLGNIINHRSTFEELIAPLSDEPVDVIVTVGRSIDPAEFGETAANVHIERYIPQSLLLPHVDAIVCHGGFNTVMGALGAAKPLVILPFAADQPEHARQCERLGTAVVVGVNPINQAALREGVRTVLSDQRYADAARRFAHEIDGLPDLATTANLLECEVG